MAKKTNPAARLLADNLHQLEHPTNHRILKMVQFSGPGSDSIKLQIAEAIVALLDNHGYMRSTGKK